MVQGAGSEIVVGVLGVFVVETLVEIARFTEIGEKVQSRIRETWFAVFVGVGSGIDEHANKIMIMLYESRMSKYLFGMYVKIEFIDYLLMILCFRVWVDLLCLDGNKIIMFYVNVRRRGERVK